MLEVVISVRLEQSLGGDKSFAYKTRTAHAKLSTAVPRFQTVILLFSQT